MIIGNFSSSLGIDCIKPFISISNICIPASNILGRFSAKTKHICSIISGSFSINIGSVSNIPCISANNICIPDSIIWSILSNNVLTIVNIACIIAGINVGNACAIPFDSSTIIVVPNWINFGNILIALCNNILIICIIPCIIIGKFTWIPQTICSIISVAIFAKLLAFSLNFWMISGTISSIALYTPSNPSSLNASTNFVTSLSPSSAKLWRTGITAPPTFVFKASKLPFSWSKLSWSLIPLSITSSLITSPKSSAFCFISSIEPLAPFKSGIISEPLLPNNWLANVAFSVLFLTFCNASIDSHIIDSWLFKLPLLSLMFIPSLLKASIALLLPFAALSIVLVNVFIPPCSLSTSIPLWLQIKSNSWYAFLLTPIFCDILSILSAVFIASVPIFVNAVTTPLAILPNVVAIPAPHFPAVATPLAIFFARFTVCPSVLEMLLLASSLLTSIVPKSLKISKAMYLPPFL